MASARPSYSWAIAPFGRIGQLLGWRWVFFFTFPIPYHPWLARALPFLLLGWVAWLALAPGEIGWTSPLWAALILAVPLSIPFLQWILLAFRLHLIQALMLPASMLLLGLAVLAGDAQPWLALLPILFFGGYAAVAVAGRLRIRAWRAENREVEERASRYGPLPPLVVHTRTQAQANAAHLLDRLELPSAYCRGQYGHQLVLRVSDPDLIAWLDEVQAMRLDLFEMPRSSGRLAGNRCVYLREDAPAAAWTLESLPAASVRAVRGEVAAVRASAPGQPSLTCWHGRPAPLSWLPGFYFLLYLRLGQQARFGPEAGFLTGKARPLGADGSQEGACAALAAALRLEGPAPHPFADPAELRRRVEGLLERRLDPELSALDRLIADPAGWMKRPLDTLLRLPDLYATRAPELVTALRTARDAEHVVASGLLAHLISVLPDSAFIGIGDDLLEVLNSKLLAGRRPLSEAEQAQSPRPFVGHRLLVRVPRLYLRLAELGERARPLLRGLAKVFPEAQTLQEALAKLDQDSSTLSE